MMSPLRRRPLSIALSLMGTASRMFAQGAADIPPADVLPLPEPPPAAPEAAAPEPAPSTNVTVNLIGRLVEKGILTREEAAVMIRQAEADALRAQAAQDAALAAAPQPLDPVTGIPAGQETRVTYVPEAVKNQMRDQIQQELMAQAREEQWGSRQIPEWTEKFRLFGDIRGRYESISFSDGNDAELLLPVNYAAINNGTPYNIRATPAQLPPLYNVNEDRDRVRLRVRAGAEILLGEGFSAGLRLATGESNSPVSPNQTLGAGNGGFSKYSVWLDRAFLAYDAGPGNGDGEELTFLIGRFDSPFMASEVQWDDDLGFDGLALRGKVHLRDNLSTFFSGGAFPLFNTDYNFSTYELEKFESTDRWLAAVQAGIEWKIDGDWKVKAGIAYYDFRNVEGEFSTPFVPLTANDAGDTDNTRMTVSQGGNTYMPLRRIQKTPANNDGTINQWQYYGLASEFRNLTLTARVDYDHYEEVKFALIGEVTKNLGFDKSEVISRAYADKAEGRTLDSPDEFYGGDMAWLLNFQVGKPGMDKKGDWLATLGYRYVESDAVLDALTDSDFGGGGTNLKGFTLGAAYALTSSVRIGAKWMTADEVDGPAKGVDTFQLDLNARF